MKNRSPDKLISRRCALLDWTCSFSTLALAALLQEQSATGLDAVPGASHNPLAERAGHHPARAKRVIFLFMPGGPS